MSRKFDRVVEQIARMHGMAPERVIKEMEIAMDEGLRCKDPRVKALWAQIPKEGERLTVEEFVRYLAEYTVS